jgi:hypothetical protein
MRFHFYERADDGTTKLVEVVDERAEEFNLRPVDVLAQLSTIDRSLGKRTILVDGMLYEHE